jgi:hypothetical protein
MKTYFSFHRSLIRPFFSNKDNFNQPQILSFCVLFALGFLTVRCDNKERFYRPDVPEKLCCIGIIDADDTISGNRQNLYSFNDYLRYITFEKSYQAEYPGEINDSLRDFSFSISSAKAELYSYHNDSSLKNLESFKLPENPKFVSGEKYILKARTEGFQDISAETVVPEPPASLILNSIHRETEPAIPPSGCSWPIDHEDSVKYAVINISSDVTIDSYYMILVEAVGLDYRLYDAALGYVDFSVRNSNVQGFSAILYGLRMAHSPCAASERSIIQSFVKAFFIDGNDIRGNRCNLTLSVKFNDFYSVAVFFTSFRIKLLTVPKEFYLFEKSLYTYEKTSEDPFSEPLYLDGNIKNGNGVFAICRSTELRIRLPLHF